MPFGTAPPAPAGAATNVLDQASPAQVDQHRSLLAEALQLIQSRQGQSPDQVAQQAGVSSGDVSHLDLNEIVQLTRHLAQAHPQIMAEVAQRFPLAKDLLPALVGGGGPGARNGNAGAGLVNDLLGAAFGGGNR